MNFSQMPLCNHPLTRKEAVKLEGRVSDLLRELNAPGDWGYGTQLGQLTQKLHSVKLEIAQVLQPMTQKDVPLISNILDERRSAITKFPSWPTDPLHALAILNEEVGELQKAVLQEVYEPEKNSAGAVRKEALQSAAMILRFIESLDSYIYSGSAQHSQGDN